MEESKICSRGYWDPANDHPELLQMREDVEVNGIKTGVNISMDELIREELFQYAKKNMALVNVYIKVRNCFYFWLI